MQNKMKGLSNNFFSFVLLFLLMFISEGNAQEKDSITTREFQLRDRLWNNFIENPSVNQSLPLVDFTETSLYAEIKNQEFSKRQTPNKVSYYGFNSKGVFTIKNGYKLFGNLNVARSYTEELSYLLFQNVSEEFSNQILASPNYPLAIRSGNGENLHYHLTGGIAGTIANNVPFSAKINYNLEKYFGVTIPKTEQEIINYSGEFELGYQLNKHQIFGIFQAEKEQNNFDYTSEGDNSIPINSIADPDYYAGFSVGYGDVLGFNAALLGGIIDREKTTFGGGYHYAFGNHFLTAMFTNSESEERYYATPYLDENNLAAIFRRTENKFDVVYVNQGEDQKLVANGSLYYGKGTNTHAFEGFTENSDNLIVKTNYQQEVTQGKLDVYWEKRKEDLAQLGIGFKSVFEENTQIDTNTTDQKITSLHTELLGNKDFKITPVSFFNIEAGFSFYFPLSNRLNYTDSNSSTSQGSVIPPRNTFGEDVILYDYAFDTLQKFGSSLGLSYQTKIKKQTTATILAKYTSLTGLEKNTFLNTNNQIFSLSLNISY